MKKILLCVLFAVTAIMMNSEVMGQGVTTASISGVVNDEAGSPLPGATVVAVHTPSGTQYGTATQADGRFFLPNVRVGGPYKITTSFVGFENKVEEGVNLSLGQTYNTKFSMKEGGVELGEIEILAQKSDILNSDRTGAATNISNDQITRLPTLSRSFGDFTRLTPQAGGPFGSIGGRNGGYNNITIDGAIFNNAFGLSSTIGGQANAQPVSLDAIDQIQVSIAPYDVRQGSFTGAAINAVTRSGDNEFRGSVYYFTRNEGFVGKKVENFEQKVADFKLNNVGFRVGGPIIKNKLFFFLNGELELRDDPPSPFFVAARPADGLIPAAGNNVSAVTAAELDQLRNFLISTYAYDPGTFENYQLKSNSYKATAKIDWNISNNHRFNIKYNYLKSFRDVPPSNSGALPNGRGLTNTNLPFLGAYYRINNNLNSVIAELNSNFGSKYSNTFTAGFTAMRDFRESTSGIFPGVEIGNGAAGQSATSFGYEPFSANNILNTDIFQISDNFTIYGGKHIITLGTYNEFYKFQNGFAPNYYGGYQFNSFADFYTSATTGAFNARQYLLRYTANPGDPFPLVETKASQLGFYLQDEYSPLNRLKLTLGIRADIPIIRSEIGQNDQAANLAYRDGDVINTGQLQKSSLLWSPRLGFNYDVFGNKSTQIRGGTGIFTGRVPYVWISNQASNNGLLFGSVVLNAAAVVSNQIAFSPDVNAYRNRFSGASATYNLAVTDKGFKFPQVWRSNFGIDQLLPWGIIATAEFAYTKDLNSVYHVNANLPDAQSNAVGADSRPRFTSNRINANITDAIIMKNTDEGSSYFITAQLQKQAENGLYASVAYTYSQSKSINDGGSIAQSIWRDRVISGDPNAIALSFSNFMVRHRVVASASYRKEYLKNFATSISLFYTAAPADRFSYTYAGDMNGDGSGGGGNDLIYIPRDASEIRLVDIVYTVAQGGGTYTADQQWSDLDAYISQDKYLNERRGQYAERNAAESPFLSQLDFRILQDFFINVKGNRNTLQLSLDIFNFGNMLNPDWGIRQTTNRAALVTFNNYSTGGNYTINGVPTAVPTGTPTFTYPLLSGTANNSPVSLTNTFRNDTGITSRWQMQFGVRYIFN